MSRKRTYVYKAAVMMFDQVIDQYWEAETTATSEKKAKSNLAFRYKKMNGLEPTVRITLPGNVYDYS